MGCGPKKGAAARPCRSRAPEQAIQDHVDLALVPFRIIFPATRHEHESMRTDVLASATCVGRGSGLGSRHRSIDARRAGRRKPVHPVGGRMRHNRAHTTARGATGCRTLRPNRFNRAAGRFRLATARTAADERAGTRSRRARAAGRAGSADARWHRQSGCSEARCVGPQGAGKSSFTTPGATAEEGAACSGPREAGGAAAAGSQIARDPA